MLLVTNLLWEHQFCSYTEAMVKAPVFLAGDETEPSV